MKNKPTRKRVPVISLVIVVSWAALALMTGTRRVVSAATFTVTNTGDNGGINPPPGAGTGTLRQAIIDANGAAGADTINFQAGLTGTIILASALPQITQDLTISGPGAGVLTVSGNHLYQVFRIDIAAVTVSISDLTISNGKSDDGGGIFNLGTLTVSNSTLSGNLSGNSAPSFGGGGILNIGTLTVTTSTLSGNSAASEGGGILNLGTLTLTNSTLSRNSAGSSGGGIFNRGTLTVTNGTLAGNSAVGGGGIFNDLRVPLTVTDSTLSGNSAFDGGGILNEGTLTVTNSTLSGNSATSGGGIFNDEGTLTVTNGTFSANSATGGETAGGGIFNEGSATVKNSIIANSTAGGNCGGSTISPLGVNFSTDKTCGPGFTVVPSAGAGGLNLGPLHDNGGPTFTHALLPGSVAIDAVISPADCNDLSAVPAPVTTDQRGLPRPADGDGNGSALCDAGAFELQPCMITCPGNITQSNDLNQCGAVVTYQATTTGDCFTVTCVPASASFFPVGTTTVTCTTTAGQSCSFTVTVKDTQPPTITCPANVTAVSAVACPPTTSTVVTFTTPIPSDNCPGATVVCNPPSGSPLPVGTTTVTCTAIDASGNTASCSFSVTVFNGRLQDDSDPNNVLLFNAATGDYRLCCGGLVFTGTGSVILKGCLFTLQHNPPDRRLLVNVDFSQKKGTASLQFPPGAIKCTITDRNMMDDTSTCL